ncbi:endoribonuclease, L-PSP family (translation initiation inhibitor) [Blattabacterium sp. (Blattella germanica) str. Bge]|uniref:Rid family detoxifying hydrolase n=1 Tax=Blattabacterium sp. (Blattella germanica) TaxID=624186 RepID=UPI0001BB62AF|nr:Rid family detoxifying hydrolase [Blattabacterium sp. (Blattella germanica)]ACY40622.1 endoribonuclease, L-PSP family (translation initiation inhibitor) [Blattabacterium sp. (Blattella germanica) str. Bge]
MIPKKISIEKIPSSGPYSTCVLVENFLFVSGQIAVDPKTGKLISDSIEIETRRIMENLKIILSENEIGFQNVIKTSIFVKNMNHFSKINDVYSDFFHDGNYPARETIQVSGLPKNANIEISLIAFKN